MDWTAVGWAEVGRWTVVKRCSELTAQQACSHLLLLLVWGLSLCREKGHGILGGDE